MLREEVKKVNQNMKAVVAIYKETREGTPEETVAAIIEKLGYTEAIETIAAIVRTVGDWDGRVYDYVRTWAAENFAYDQKELMDAYIFQPSEIHPAHINQIGQAAMKAEAPTPADFDEVVEAAVVEEISAELEAEAASAHLKHTMLTTEILTRFEALVDISGFTPKQCEEIEFNAYVACMGRYGEDRWTWFAHLYQKYIDPETDLLTLELPKKVAETIEAKKTRSAWAAGVKAYALELMEQFTESCADGWNDPDDMLSPSMLSKALLNGAADWDEYSEGGCSLIYNADIAERLCTPSELKKTQYGMKDPNSRENWIDCQTRALRQAYWMIEDTVRDLKLAGLARLSA